MKLLSVNVSMPKEVPYQGETVSTGIFKEPVTGSSLLGAMSATLP
jgi:MOSC domain-containing protein YiiM